MEGYLVPELNTSELIKLAERQLLSVGYRGPVKIRIGISQPQFGIKMIFEVSNPSSTEYSLPIWLGSFQDFTFNCGIHAISSPRPIEAFKPYWGLLLNITEAYAVHRLKKSMLLGSDNVNSEMYRYMLGAPGWQVGPITHNNNYQGDPQHKVGVFYKNIGEFQYPPYNFLCSPTKI